MDGFDYSNLTNSLSTYNNNDYNVQYYCTNTKQLTPEEEQAKKEKEEREKKLREKMKSESIASLGIIKAKHKFGMGFLMLDIKEDTYEERFNTFKDIELMSIDKDHNVTIDMESTDPVYSGRRLYNKRTVIFKPNVINTLIGCNGCGKSTILLITEDRLKSNYYPCIKYDNLHDGGVQELDMFDSSNESLAMLSLQMTCSEGENINLNFSSYFTTIKKILSGKYIRNENLHLYRDPDHIFVLLDAIDSGLSIDNINALKINLEELISISKENNKYLYIIAAANSFELVRETRSWDVQASKEVFFGKDYEAYRARVIQTKQKIIERINKE